jgi:hypothetical protein
MGNVVEIFFCDNVTGILFSIFSPENRDVCKIMWISVLQYEYETNDDGHVWALHAGKLGLQALTLNM